jgi:predicted SAM-dependent methyltransferase
MKTFLHFGCGPVILRPRAGEECQWVNIDMFPQAGADLMCDYLLLGDKFKDVDGIYSCHSLEHLDYPTNAKRFFSEAFRLLKPGGTLHVNVPDLRKLIHYYINGQTDQIYHPPEGKFYYDNPDSAAERFHFAVNAYEHKMVYDNALLWEMFLEAGFVNIEECPSTNMSRVAELSGHGRFENISIAMEGIKPE